ncbi:MAG: DUF3662 and FHA domain-containing protein [Actinomycetota bacterium]
MGLHSFELALERMVDTVFTRSSRTTLRPVELGRRMLRDIDDHRSVDVQGRRIVPNVFAFHLSPRDHAGLADIDQALRHELCEAAREYARDEGYFFVGPVSVSIDVNNELKPGRFGISSQFREVALAAPAPPAVQAPPLAANPEPEVMWAAAAPVVAPEAPPVAAPITPVAATAFAVEQQESPSVLTRGTIVMPSGERIPVTDEAIRFGRLPDCTVTLNDPNVSRYHAEVRPGVNISIVDLGSTNGTKVNGLTITGEVPLNNGDIISMGTTHLRFEAA